MLAMKIKTFINVYLKNNLQNLKKISLLAQKESKKYENGNFNIW